MKKICISSVVSFFSLSSVALAQNTNSTNPNQSQLTYNQESSYDTKDDLDCFVTADYLYWQWSQGLLQVGTLVTPVDSDYSFGNAKAVLQSPGYSSGFQTGVGYKLKGMDDWNLFAEYTWYRNVSKNNLSTGSDSVFVLPSAFFRRDQEALSAYHYSGSVFSKARLGFQSLDFLLQKSLYIGKKLTTTISSGLRAQWISNKLNQKIQGSIVEFIFDETTTTHTSIQQTSWGLGPKFSFGLNYLLGCGIKFITDMSMSFLYTSYNAYTEYSNTKIGNPFKQSTLHNSGSIKPVGEAFLGLGWGSYFCNNSLHLDLSLGYDFDIYWNYIVATAPISQSVANLQLQGLKASVRFDF